MRLPPVRLLPWRAAIFRAVAAALRRLAVDPRPLDQRVRESGEW